LKSRYFRKLHSWNCCLRPVPVSKDTEFAGLADDDGGCIVESKFVYVLDSTLGFGLGPEASHGQGCESHQYSEHACNNAERLDAHRPDENKPANAAKQRPNGDDANVRMILPSLSI
jgi:hypothetical protein